MSLPVGIHDDIPPEVYHSDQLAAEPSLSRSGIVTLERLTPAHFKALHPKLTDYPEYARPSTKAMDLGSVIHHVLLGNGSKFLAKDCSDFTNKDGSPAKTWGNAEATAWKRDMEASGRIVIDTETYAEAEAIAMSARRAIEARYGGGCFDAALCEQTLIWERGTRYAPILCRARPDIILPNIAILDPKSTAKSISDHELTRAIESNGADVQAVFYRQGLVATTGAEMDLPFVFVYVESVPPYATRFAEIDDDWQMRVTYRIEKACDTFARCLKTGEWPGWPSDSVTLAAPPYKMNAWLDAELAEMTESLVE